MEFITDRTEEDVLQGAKKGTYQDTDLNRVESAVAEISAQFQSLGMSPELVTKTDWTLPDLFSAESWVTESQMRRYLDNVAAVQKRFPSGIRLPAAMSGLNWEGANNIEKVIKAAVERIPAIRQAYRYSGEIYAGEE